MQYMKSRNLNLYYKKKIKEEYSKVFINANKISDGNAEKKSNKTILYSETSKSNILFININYFI